MSMLKVCGSDEPLYSDSVFASHTYTGNGSTQTINNGIDLAGKGGLVWIKSRSLTVNHSLFDTQRGGFNAIFSSTIGSQSSSGDSGVAFNSSGFNVINSGFSQNDNTATYASWTFRKSPRFF